MRANPIVWFEIYVQDMARARKFYETVLDVKLERLPGTDLEMWSFPGDDKTYGAPGALVYMKGFPPGGGATLVYFGVDDCAVEEARAVKAGSKVEKKKFSIGEYGFISLVYDSEGNMIGLHSTK